MPSSPALVTSQRAMSIKGQVTLVERTFGWKVEPEPGHRLRVSWTGRAANGAPIPRSLIVSEAGPAWTAIVLLGLRVAGTRDCGEEGFIPALPLGES